MSEDPRLRALQNTIGERIDPVRVRDLGIAIVKSLRKEESDMFHVAAALGFAAQFYHLGQTAHQHLLDPDDWDTTESLSEQLDMAVQIGGRFGASLGMLITPPKGEG